MRRSDWTQYLAMALALVACGAAPAVTMAPQGAFARGDFDAAYAADTATLVADPTNIAANLEAATIALYHNDLASAASFAGRVPANAPDDARARAQRIVAAILQRRADAADFDVAALPARIPFVVEDPLPLITVAVNGRQGLFIIDTGGGATVLDPEFAAEIGVTLTAAGSGVFAGGRQAAVQRGTAATLQVGSVTMHDVEVMGLPTRQLPFFGERKPDGVIGTRFFTHFLTTLDYVNGALILRRRSDSAAFEHDASGSSVPMLYVGDHFLFVRGQINDGPEGWLNVDTGLAGGGVAPSQAAVADSHITLDEANAGQGIGGGGPVRVVPFTAAVTVGTRRVDGVRGLFTPDGDQFGIFPFAVRGAVSHGYFRDCALTFDFVAMRLVMQ